MIDLTESIRVSFSCGLERACAWNSSSKWMLARISSFNEGDLDEDTWSDEERVSRRRVLNRMGAAEPKLCPECSGGDDMVIELEENSDMYLE